jgi:DNA helicase-2/ATP-dependent DNA helicase PcrA
MHALALRILRAANVLATLYPSDPRVLDEWETSDVYDEELAHTLGCPPGRAAEVRKAHDAQWQTLNPNSIAQAAITQAEITGFNAFHGTRRNLYCCVLPGEVIYECVTRIQLGAIQADHLPSIEHLIVDEYQDLNACDQEFVRLLVVNGATLFVAGDDDQSIYSFRHANPNGIVQFNAVYPAASTYNLTACFRCTPAVLQPALALIRHNPNRLNKQLLSLYATAAPPVQGSMRIWSFQSPQAEAVAIAQSCERLINGGMGGQEDQIVILVSNRRLQLPLITQELSNRGLPVELPRGQALRDEPVFRAVYSILRLLQDRISGEPDYIAHRDILAQLHGVGTGTCISIANACINNNQNFHTLLYLPAIPTWLQNRANASIARVRACIAQISTWSLQDTIAQRSADIAQLLTGTIFVGSAAIPEHVQKWNDFAALVPGGMTLDEVLMLLAADEASQQRILNAVYVRLGQADPNQAPQPTKIRILTMHGAKGLSGKVVFIPSLSQGILPTRKAVQAVGLLVEQRRLFYVSLTRAKAACIVSHVTYYAGAQAHLIAGQFQTAPPRSQFLQEMGIASQNRNTGLTTAEATQIIQDISNL